MDAWHWDIHTLFPDWFSWTHECRPVKNAIAAGELSLATHDMRRVSPHRYGHVDDTPYGGGPGMLLRVDIVIDSIEQSLDATISEIRGTHRIVALTPAGRQFDEAMVNEWTVEKKPTIILCGRYEGFDHRIHEHVATEEVSIGPYVLSGGEPAAMVMLDACARKLPGALGNEESLAEESWQAGDAAMEAEYPQYTRPEEYRGWAVPEILLSGHHENIAQWRRMQATQRTAAKNQS